MLWLKRNLILVAAVLVAVLLTLFGGLSVWHGYQENKVLDGKLGETKTELERLVKVQPSITDENMAAARKDAEQARKYSEECKKLFAPTPFQPVNSQTFKSMLETTLAELRRQGQQAGVDVVSNYNFSFESEIRQLRFQNDTLKPLSEQLHEISTMARAVFKAKVHRLEQIRRVAVSEYDSQNSGTDILTGATFQHDKPTGMDIWPYEITVQCFSGDLAATLRELGQIPRMFLVKTITVQTEAVTQTPGSFVPSPDPGGSAPAETPRPPGGRRFLPTSQAGGGARPETKAADLKAALEEKPLKAILLIHVVKPSGK